MQAEVFKISFKKAINNPLSKKLPDEIARVICQ